MEPRVVVTVPTKIRSRAKEVPLLFLPVGNHRLPWRQCRPSILQPTCSGLLMHRHPLLSALPAPRTVDGTHLEGLLTNSKTATLRALAMVRIQPRIHLLNLLSSSHHSNNNSKTLPTLDRRIHLLSNRNHNRNNSPRHKIKVLPTLISSNHHPNSSSSLRILVANSYHSSHHHPNSKLKMLPILVTKIPSSSNREKVLQTSINSSSRHDSTHNLLSNLCHSKREFSPTLISSSR